MLGDHRRTGLRERVLRAFGQGDLYDRLRAAEQAAATAATAASRGGDGGAAERLARYEGLEAAGRLAVFDFPVRPRVRAGHGRPPWPALHRRIAAGAEAYAERLASLLPFAEAASRVAPHAADGLETAWINDWFPAFDAFSYYALVAQRRPRTLLEIGSGTSTKFARRAVRDHGLATRVVSVDPAPRSAVDVLCDEVVRCGLEDAPSGLFHALRPGDIVFFDGSHEALQNSDATVFFLELLPDIPPGVLVGVHDIFLPEDYPPGWEPRWYSEQYLLACSPARLLACWLLGGDRAEIHLPVHFCAQDRRLAGVLDPLWSSPNLQGVWVGGGCFWFELKN